jgi:hypothetical protein
MSMATVVPQQPPRILIDEGHHNFHTTTTAYAAYTRLLRQNGFIVTASPGRVMAAVLKGIDVFCIVSPRPESNDVLAKKAEAAGEPLSWSAAAAVSALSPDEISVIEAWVRGGGSLLLVLDHPPYSGAGSTLARALEHGKGRLIVLGEAGMLAAGPGTGRDICGTSGLADPRLSNRRFALNIAQWLARRELSTGDVAFENKGCAPLGLTLVIEAAGDRRVFAGTWTADLSGSFMASTPSPCSRAPSSARPSASRSEVPMASAPSGSLARSKVKRSHSRARWM